MNLARARREIDSLAKIEAARMDWVAAVAQIADTGTGFMGPQGVSSNEQFRDDAKKLFDRHVQHLINRHTAAVIAALDVGA